MEKLQKNSKQVMKYFEDYAKAAEIASCDLSPPEEFARNLAFKNSKGGSIIDGWLWDICWSAARDYYIYLLGRTLAQNPAVETSGNIDEAEAYE